ncbi:MAG: 2-amino-4-hydroxy-6-hydroxymethyldihydropteridine diphosphokinase, partial [SAR324 cluster bacterium]|nr:2-amino-4-hydroxy-6-hydroxymethyldihydropteridine diphosphokinase [SAR324 cluster bacterium]
RNIDLDILSYGNKIVDTGELKIPHPEIEKRSFVLIPLLELSPNWVHPIKGISIGSIWDSWKRTNKESLPKIIKQKINLDDQFLKGLIIPGVGAFSAAMNLLQKKKLINMTKLSSQHMIKITLFLKNWDTQLKKNLSLS